MIEGNPPFPTKPENEVPKAYIAGERPPFMAPTKRYADGVKEYSFSPSRLHNIFLHIKYIGTFLFWKFFVSSWLIIRYAQLVNDCRVSLCTG